jgi:tetratricopeptide (TPR) repeat protein
VLNGMAWNYLQQSAPERALPYSRAAVNLITSLIGKDVLVAAYLHTYAAVLEQLGRLGEALVSYRQALGVAEACGSRRSTVASYHGLGATYLRLGAFDEAELNLRIAIDLYGMLGQTAEAAQASQQLEEAREETRSRPASR